MLIKLGCGGVVLAALHPSLWKVFRAVVKVWGEQEPVITSTWEGTHLPWSLHYQKRALDFRPPARHIGEVVGELKQRLGPDYDVIQETNHIHIEYDPKGA